MQTNINDRTNLIMWPTKYPQPLLPTHTHTKKAQTKPNRLKKKETHKKHNIKNKFRQMNGGFVSASTFVPLPKKNQKPK